MKKIPDKHDEWLLIESRLDGTIEEILAYYNVYIEQWVTTVRDKTRDKNKINIWDIFKLWMQSNSLLASRLIEQGKK